MERWIGRVALVTGASSGIGAAICKELVKHGLSVFGCARNVEKIQAMAQEEEVKSASGNLQAVKCDLTRESDILAMFDEIRQKSGRIDICVNNAAFSAASPLLAGSTSDWRAMFEVNVLALCICSREAIKLMMEKNIDDGQIIQISSIGGYYLPPADFKEFNYYCGTKFMVRALAEGLRKEVTALKSHIRVALISPGITETEFLEKAMNADIANSLYTAIKCLQPKDIADIVVNILKSPPHVDVNDIIVQPVEHS